MQDTKKKRVAILSMQRVINYGSYLQAYGLRELLYQSGADDVCFIDIKPGQPIAGYGREQHKSPWQRLFNRQRISQTIRHLLHLPHSVGAYFILKRFRACIIGNWDKLGLNLPNDNPDMVVIGSDEVFNCCQNSSYGFTTQLYGDIPGVKRVISYAGSFGHTVYAQLQEHSLVSPIEKAMKRMTAISVRDDNSAHIVKRILGKEPLMHIDPVLAYGFKNEIEKMPPVDMKDYIVIYTYLGRIKSKDEIKAIKSFAKRHGKKMVSITCNYIWTDKTIVPDTPIDVLRWFKYADYIITDTFHGTIFSVITHSKFVTMIRDSNRNKLTSLLSIVGLSSRALSSPERLDEIMHQTIDYSAVESKLQEHRTATATYLKENVDAI
jgi:hypothetical protein